MSFQSVTNNTWSRVCYVSQFPDWTATLQFEWRWKQGSSSIDVIGTNIGDVYIYDISFNERDVLTSYYNYYQLSNEYIVYGGIYRITLTAPTGGNQQAVNYFLTPLEPNSEYFFSSDVSGSFGISNSTQYNYDIVTPFIISPGCCVANWTSRLAVFLA